MTDNKNIEVEIIEDIHNILIPVPMSMIEELEAYREKRKMNKIYKKRTHLNNPEKYSKEALCEYAKSYYKKKLAQDENFMIKQREKALARYYKKKEEKKQLEEINKLVENINI